MALLLQGDTDDKTISSWEIIWPRDIIQQFSYWRKSLHYSIANVINWQCFVSRILYTTDWKQVSVQWIVQRLSHVAESFTPRLTAWIMSRLVQTTVWQPLVDDSVLSDFALLLSAKKGKELGWDSSDTLCAFHGTLRVSRHSHSCSLYPAWECCSK